MGGSQIHGLKIFAHALVFRLVMESADSNSKINPEHVPPLDIEIMDRINTSRDKAILSQQEIFYPGSSILPGAYSGKDDSWNIDKFKKRLKIKIIKMTKTEMEFDLIGIDTSLANAYRRILLSEVPSMAIEKVYMYNNTSIIPDEILAHRLGLIPLKANPLLFGYLQKGDTTGTENDTIEYELKVKCSWNPKREKDATKPDDLYSSNNVYSSQIKWIPMGSQAKTLKLKEKDVGPVHSDILIAKLRPGHELDMRLRAVKGIGKDHAKFSPVATAFYRLLPEITLKKEFYDADAERLQKCFSPGVIKLVEKKGRKVAQVHNPRYDSCSRNVQLYDDFAESVIEGRVKDHFIFSIESVGALPPDRLFLESIKILRRKCKKFINQIDSGIE